ncbi:hypothetical protein ACQV2W_06370 [Facklamia sp. P12934]|uniref:hypothetical protein n=1 Tax=Facklamia sp. P12934 TaxID=3421948 RepID=UPI003D1826AE
MSKLDNLAIETLAVNAVKDTLSVSPFMSPFISDNDKEPSWDGDVYLYKTRDKKIKSNLKGRVPVQVKGKHVANFSNRKVKYPIQISDLQNYLNDGGIIFFLVHIVDATKKKIYYIELTPVRIKKVLNFGKNTHSYSFEMKEFPNNEAKKASIFFNCFDHCQKQKSFVQSEPYFLKDIKSVSGFDSISMKVTGVGISDPIEAFLSGDVYMYLEGKEFSIPFPIEDIPENLRMFTEKSAEVKVKDKSFYHKIGLVRDINSSTIKIGKSLTLEFSGKNKVTFNYRHSDSVKALKIDLDFFISFFENKSFYINDNEVPFPNNEAFSEGFDIEDNRELLDIAKKCVEVLDFLNCEDDLNLFELNQEELRNINILWDALIENKSVVGLKADLPAAMKLKIQNLNFILNMEKRTGFLEDEYIISDFFSKKTVEVVYYDNNEKIYLMSRFESLTEEDLLQISNFSTKYILESFKEIDNKDIFNRANFFLLKLINAYDKSDGKREDLLILAEDFVNWLKNNKERIGEEVLLLNELQIYKRKRDLSISEEQSLWSIIERFNDDHRVKAGAYILLNQKIPVENCLKK